MVLQFPPVYKIFLKRKNYKGVKFKHRGEIHKITFGPNTKGSYMAFGIYRQNIKRGLFFVVVWSNCIFFPKYKKSSKHHKNGAYRIRPTTMWNVNEYIKKNGLLIKKNQI